MSPEPNRRLALWGASGRMGTEILRLLGAPGAGFELVQAVVSAGSGHLGQSASGEVQYTAPGPLDPRAEVLVDFSSAAALGELLDQARSAGRPVVSGTTGLEPPDHELLRETARHVPVFWAPNFSIGVAALIAAVRAVLPLLEGFDVELVETHHGAKKDAPSGTALKILQAIEDAKREPQQLVHGRHGASARSRGEIGVHALRGGSNPGRHEVHLLGRSEDIVLCHQAWGREVFALGALRAARFVLMAEPGLYGMEHLVAPAADASTPPA